MKRTILGSIVGYAVWTVLWLVGGMGLAAIFPSEHDVFTAGGSYDATNPLLASLVLSIAASFLAGASARRVDSKVGSRAAVFAALLLLLTGVGIQASVWNRMPLWYHVSFLVLIVPITLVGARPRSAARKTHR
ncbi:MAG: hypothetical protein V3T86_10975 [Planctomycetota bacterium]